MAFGLRKVTSIMNRAPSQRPNSNTCRTIAQHGILFPRVLQCITQHVPSEIFRSVMCAATNVSAEWCSQFPFGPGVPEAGQNPPGETLPMFVSDVRSNALDDGMPS